MSNAITTIETTFAVQRVSKAGKIATRGVLGVITSGNTEERANLFANLAAKLIPNNTFGPIMAELVRVFPANTLKAPRAKKGEPQQAIVVGDIVDVAGTLYMATASGTLEPFNPAASDAATINAYCVAVLRKFADKEAKGEKAVYIQVCRAVRDHLKAKAEAKEAAQAA